MSAARVVRVLRRAQTDLEEIHRYIARDDPAAADRVLDALIGAIERLGRVPHSAPVARDPRLRSLGFRALVRGRHIVLYKIVGRHVRVYRVVHQRREYARLF